MRKTLLSIALCLSFLRAEPTDIPTLDELQDVFGQLSKSTNPRNRVIEAMYYEYGDPNNKVEQDLEKAIGIYYDIFEKTKDPVASFKLGMYSWALLKPQGNETLLSQIKKAFDRLPSKDPYFYFSEGFYGNKQDIKNIATGNAIVNNGILAGVFATTQQRIKDAQTILNQPGINDKALAMLWMAFSMIQAKQEGMANLFLDKACRKQDESRAVQEFCNSKEVIRNKK